MGDVDPAGRRPLLEQVFKVTQRHVVDDGETIVICGGLDDGERLLKLVKRLRSPEYTSRDAIERLERDRAPIWSGPDVGFGFRVVVLRVCWHARAFLVARMGSRGLGGAPEPTVRAEQSAPVDCQGVFNAVSKICGALYAVTVHS